MSNYLVDFLFAILLDRWQIDLDGPESGNLTVGVQAEPQARLAIDAKIALQPGTN